MAEWMKTSLIDIVKLIGGGTPKTTKSEDVYKRQV